MAETSQLFSKSRTKGLHVPKPSQETIRFFLLALVGVYVEKQAKLLSVQLSKDSIIAASLNILDSFGLADMTMRRVASALGVAPGALYWHFKNKQALIDATARTILADFLAHSLYDDLGAACAALRAAMLTTRDGAELISASLMDPQLRSEVTDVLIAALPAPAPIAGAVTALHFVMGATVLEQAEYLRIDTISQSGTPSSAGVSDPNLGLKNRHEAAKIQADEQFQAGLDIIRQGLTDIQR